MILAKGNLVNRLNFPIDENLNRWNGMVGSCDFMDAMINMHKLVHEMRHPPQTKVEEIYFSHVGMRQYGYQY